MGFIQPCFIESVDSDVIERLEELGYWHCPNGYGEWHVPMEHCHYIECDTWGGRAYCIGKVCKPSLGSLDCGKNKDLFFAIAALRDDIDKNQWFTDGYLWFKCGNKTCDENIKYYLNTYNRLFHKATVQELIEHFKEVERT